MSEELDEAMREEFRDVYGAEPEDADLDAITGGVE
jgi:hypothetical protein